MVSGLLVAPIASLPLPAMGGAIASQRCRALGANGGAMPSSLTTDSPITRH